MKNPNKLILSIAAATMSAVGGLHAVQVQGSVDMSGGAVLRDAANNVVSTVDSATQVTLWTGSAAGNPRVISVSPGSSFAGFGVAVNDATTFSAPWIFNPSTPQPGLWTVDGFTFSAASSVIGFQGSGFLNITAIGTITGNGFDPTPATFRFSAQDPSASGIFSWSASTTAIPSAASLGDFVWNDLNHDGVQNRGEPGIPGVTVSLAGPGGPQTAVTDGTGFYQFTGLAPGSYTVTVGAPPAGFVGTLTGQGTTATDSNSSPTTVVLAAGENNPTIDFGFFQPASLGDFVWNDLNHNGVQDPGEPGILGVTVSLTGPGGPQTTITDGTGFYQFTGLLPGSYTVTVGAGPAGFVSTLTGQGTVTTDSNPSPTTVVLAAGDSDQTIDFGFWKPAAIGDYVWLDINANGQQDATEPGLDGLTVNLLDTGGNILFTTTTGDNPNLAGLQQGYYEFTGLVPGSYVVQFFTGGGYDKFTTLDVVPDATDSDANPVTGLTAAYTLVSGEFNHTVDAGLRPIDLSLTKTVNNTTPAIGSSVDFAITVSNASGFSTATGVTVKDVLPAGLTFVSSSASLGSYSSVTNIWTVGTLASAGGSVLHIVATVTTPGTKTNYAQVQSAVQVDIDSTPGNNSTTEDDDDSVSLTPPSGQTLTSGDTATIGYWHNKNGQALILSMNGGPGAKNLATWLATSFPYLFGANAGANNLTGKTNTDVAALFLVLFNKTGAKTDAQTLASALAVYVTNPVLAGGSFSGPAGFNLSIGGTGAKAYNVGSYGTAIGLVNDTTYTILQLLQQANLRKQQGTYDANAFNSIFDGINNLGDRSDSSGSALPSPWTSRDIGPVGAVGSASYSGSTFIVTGSGNDIEGTSDELQYTYQAASGDCSMVAKVSSVQYTANGATAGVMVRETLTDTSRGASISVTPASGIQFISRAATGGATTATSVAGLVAPYWVKVTRVGNTFTASRSTNGTTWTQVGAPVTITMGTSVYIGLGVNSKLDGTLCTATFDSVTASP